MDGRISQQICEYGVRVNTIRIIKLSIYFNLMRAVPQEDTFSNELTC